MMSPVMAADPTQILAVLQTNLAGLYVPALPVYLRKGEPGPPQESPEAGFTQGLVLPSFVLSISEADDVDEIGCFELVSVGYKCEVSYLKAANAVPGLWVEDDDIRQKRQDVRRLLYLPRLTGLDIADVQMGTAKPYQVAATTVVYSLIWFTYTMTEQRLS